MIKKLTFGVFVLLAICSCTQKEQDPFEISKHRIGRLTHITQVKALDSVYVQDSIVRVGVNPQGLSASNEIEIYEKGGAKLLVLEANEAGEESTIKRIQLMDDRFHTTSGLSTASTFGAIKAKHTISKINNTLSTAVVFLDSIDAYFTIDKDELPDEFKYNTDAKIEVDRIPDEATIKHLWIQWEE